MAKTGPAATDPDVRLRGIASSDPNQTEFTAAGQVTPAVELRESRASFAAWAGSGGQTGGQVALECSFDAGTTWLNCTLPSGVDNLWNAPVQQVFQPTHERAVLYRLRCAALTTGSLRWRISA